MSRARCIKFYEFGAPENVLKVEYKHIQQLRDNEVLVRMLARPINPSDLIPIRGAYSHRITLPTIPGYEGVGIVEAAGPSAPQSLVGKRVLPLRGEGTWQELVKTTADFVVQLPDAIDDYTGAQLYINPVTAWVICMEELQLKPHDTLLVNACGSAIGHILAQLAKIVGFQLIAVTRNDTYTSELHRLGASHVINTSESSLYETVMELTNGVGVDAAIDSVGGLSGTNLAFCLRPNGTFLSIGLLSGVQVNWSAIETKARVNAKIFHLRHWNSKTSIEDWHEPFHCLLKFIQDGQLKLMNVAACYHLLDVKEAIQATSTRIEKGKVFLIG